MTNRVILVRHNELSAEDRVVTWCRANGLDPVSVFPFKGEPLEAPDETVCASVVYGGPFNVFETDKHPFLIDEHRWIEQCMAGDIPLLGICQGAQSIAHVLGAYAGPRPGEPHEFGYYPIRPTDAGRDLFPDPLHVAQAHFHEFEIPSGAENLASSELFPQQAMRYGTCTYGFQFHAEITKQGFREWQLRDWASYGKPGAQTREEQDRLMDLHDDAQHTWFMGFLDRLIGQAGRSVSAAE